MLTRPVFQATLSFSFSATRNLQLRGRLVVPLDAPVGVTCCCYLSATDVLGSNKTVRRVLVIPVFSDTATTFARKHLRTVKQFKSGRSCRAEMLMSTAKGYTWGAAECRGTRPSHSLPSYLFAAFVGGVSVCALLLGCGRSQEPTDEAPITISKTPIASTTEEKTASIGVMFRAPKSVARTTVTREQDQDLEITVAWRQFRKRFPYHTQVVAFSAAQSGATIVVVGEPPPTCTLQDIVQVFGTDVQAAEVRQSGVGNDG